MYYQEITLLKKYYYCLPIFLLHYTIHKKTSKKDNMLKSIKKVPPSFICFSGTSRSDLYLVHEYDNGQKKIKYSNDLFCGDDF